ncbi:MAG: DUF2341 domain-containing protein [Saprospirales bacterium]|nr:DUF2341 domain-containing protein [Saprospirales bacterium]
MKQLITLFTLTFTLPLFAQDCLPDWDYFREITIDNTQGGNFTDFQVKLEVNTSILVSAGKLNADGADLRFTDPDCNLLYYFMDSVATNPANVIWVKIPFLAAGSTETIRVYYGNPDATPYSNGDSTFVFFDDFESGTVDPGKWDPVGGYATLEVVDGVLNYASNGSIPGPRFKFVRTVPSFTEPMIFEFAAEIQNTNGFGFSSSDVALERIIFRQSSFGFDTLNQVAFLQDTIDNGYQVNGLYPFIRYPIQLMQDAAILAGINAQNHLQTNYFGNLSNGSVSTDPYELVEVQMTGFHFILSSFLQNNTIFLDYLRVRKPALNPPVATVGSEQENPAINSAFELAPAGSILLFPNPAKELVQIISQLTEPLEVTFFNSFGQPVYQGRDTQSIQLGNLPSGPYWVVVRRLKDQVVVHASRLLVEN